MNIDLKGFTQRFYDLVGGDLETVKDAIVLSAARCHVEVTTLIIPGENDSEAEMDEEARWLASIRPDLPLHISRFFPRHRMQDRGPTDVETVYRLSDVARRHLRYVYPETAEGYGIQFLRRASHESGQNHGPAERVLSRLCRALPHGRP
jgi:pyruvate formate lyase activating enzyme